MVMQIVGAFIGVYFTSIMVDAPKKYMAYSGVVGALGWFLYLITVKPLGPYMSNYISGLAVAFMAQCLARALKSPVTIFLIPGFYPLVPGVGMYRTILYLIQGEQDLFISNLKLTLLIAVMLALSIFTVDSVVTTFFRTKKKVHEHFHKKISPFRIKKPGSKL